MKNKGGRPTVMTEEVLQKLEQAFSQGMTDEEACFYAGISTSTLYNYCNDNSKFLERKEQLKKKPKMQSRIIVNKVLQGELGITKDQLDTAKWYLERKAKDEFSTKTEHSVDGDMQIRRAREEAIEAFNEQLRASWND